MRSRAQIAQHPVHPMLIPVPITSFLLALLGDIVYLSAGNPFWHAFANWTMGIGILGGLAAAIPGLIDYAYVVPRGEAQRTALTHMILNVSLVGLFIVNLALRLALGATGGAWLGVTVALTLLGVGMLGVSGWLGGHLVYVYRVGVEPVEPGAARISMAPEAPRPAQRPPV